MNRKVAIMYDFDLTLTPKFMHEYGFFEGLKTNNEEFYKMFSDFSKKNNMDEILAFSYCANILAKSQNTVMTKEFLINSGKNIEFFEGVDSWFERINAFGQSIGLEIEHFIISCGNTDIIKGCDISKYFKNIFANDFYYDKSGEIVWPSVLVNYTTKTQYISRIRKGEMENLYDSHTINKKIPTDQQYICYENMIYIGDGETDIPCMQILNDRKGYSVSVYDTSKPNKEAISKQFFEDGRVNAFAPANYEENSILDKLIKQRLVDISNISVV